MRHSQDLTPTALAVARFFQEGLDMAQKRSSVFLTTPSDEVQTDQIEQTETLTVCTANSVYELRVVCGSTGEVRVVGGRHFPQTTCATLLGSSVASLLKVRTICVGLSMELIHEGRRIVTSPVVSIAVDYTDAANSSSSAA